MNVSNMYRKLKQILSDSNMALANKGMQEVSTLNKIFIEIEKMGEINRLPYFLKRNVIALTESDLNNITIINNFNLSRYTKLAKVTIPNSVTTIGDSAFYNCDSLTEVTIGDSVTTIGKDAFYNCDSLTDIYLKPIIPPALYNRYVFSSNIIIHVPVGSGDAYRNATNWSYYANQIIEI